MPDEPQNQSSTLQEPPTSAAPVEQNTTPLEAKKPSRKKLFIISGAVAAVVVLLGGGSALAYNLWYQNPEKVIIDGITNLVKQKAPGTSVATMAVANDQMSLKFRADIRSDQKIMNGTINASLTMKGDFAALGDINVNADVAGDQNTAYFKLKDVKALTQKLASAYIDMYAAQARKAGMTISAQDVATQKAQFMKQLNPIVSKLDNRWLKFETSVSESQDEETQCVTDTFKKFTTDDKQLKEITDVYKENRFIVIKEKLGAKDGSLGYVLDIDQDIARDFGAATKETSIAKALKACDKTPTVSSEMSTTSNNNNLKNTRIELWVSRWSHQITRIHVSTETNDKTATSIHMGADFEYGKVDGLTIPENATDVKDLQKEFETTSGADVSTAVPASPRAL